MTLLSRTLLLLLAAGAGKPAVDPRSEQALVEEVSAVHDLADHRPTHVVPPLEGTFAQHAAPHFVHLDALVHDHLIELDKALNPFIRGERGWDSVPESLRAIADRAAPEVQGILEATHAASGRLPQNLTGLLRIADPMPEDSVVSALRIAAAEVRRSLEANRNSEALGRCTDGLAVARELSYGNALGRMYAALGIRLLTPVCIKALEANRPSQSQCDALASIAGHTAPLSAMFEQEKIFGELSYFGSNLDDDTRAALPPEARRVLDQPPLPRLSAPPRFAKLRHWLFGSWARRDFVDAMNDLIAVADGPPAVADPVLLNFDDQHHPWSWTLVGTDGSPSNWLRFARRWRGAQTRLNAVAAACTLLATKSPSGWARPPALAVDARTGSRLTLEIIDGEHAALEAAGDPSRKAEELDFALVSKQIH